MTPKPSYCDLAEKVKKLETELQQLKEDMKSSSLPFDTHKAFDNTFPFRVKDENGVYIFINKSFTDTFGLIEKDILGKTDYDLFSLEDADVFRKEDLRIFETGETLERDNEYLWGGQKNFCSFKKFLLPGVQENSQFIGIIDFDKTQQHQALEALQKSEKRFKSYYELGLVGMATTSLEKGWLEFNDTLHNMFGYTRDEFALLTWQELTHPEDLEEDLTEFNKVLRGETEGYIIEKRFIHKDGSFFFAAISVMAARKENGSIEYFVAFVYDITERKKAEQEKDVQLQLFHLISGESDFPIIVEDVLALLKTWSRVDAIAIRLRDSQDFPYYKFVGFSEEFIQKEFSLYNFEYQKKSTKCEKKQSDLECMCGRVIKGVLDPSLPFFTKRGSFHINSTSIFLSHMKDAQVVDGLRKHCNNAGYESILLVPLRVGKNTLGLIQFNHKEKDHFSSHFISLVESLAGYISVAVAQRLAESQLREKKFELEEMNSALKVIIKNRENDLLEHDRSIHVNIQQLVLPCIERLRLHSLQGQQKTQLNILENNLKSITSPFLRKKSDTNIVLTPTLAQVADMIKNGLTSKEIATMLEISVTSVETYRKRIRTRLNLKNSNINLKTYLMNMK